MIAVASGESEYKALRYSVGNNPHLQVVFSPKSGKSSLEKEWKESLPDEELTIGEKKWFVVDTDDVRDILFCGIGGSCLNHAGAPEVNKALLGYMRDGKRRMIAVKDAKGKINARCMLLLVLDKDNLPVLLQEPTYGSSQIFHDNLNASCERKAKIIRAFLCIGKEVRHY